MAKQGNINDLFSGFNFFMPDSSTMFPVNDIMTSGMKLMEEASEISKEFMFKGFEGSDLFSFFQNTAEVMTSSYAGYFEIMGLISKDTYDQLIKKYDEIQKELAKYKKQATQKENKLKDQDKKLKALQKEIVNFKNKIDELEKELAAEKITKVTSQTKSSKVS